MTENELLTFTEAGRIAGVSRTTIAKWVKLGGLPVSRMPSSVRVRISRSDLMRFLDAMQDD